MSDIHDTPSTVLRRCDGWCSGLCESVPRFGHFVIVRAEAFSVIPYQTRVFRSKEMPPLLAGELSLFLPTFLCFGRVPLARWRNSTSQMIKNVRVLYQVIPKVRPVFYNTYFCGKIWNTPVYQLYEITLSFYDFFPSFSAKTSTRRCKISFHWNWFFEVSFYSVNIVISFASQKSVATIEIADSLKRQYLQNMMGMIKFSREIHVIFFAHFVPHVVWHIIAIENHVSSICEFRAFRYCCFS